MTLQVSRKWVKFLKEELFLHFQSLRKEAIVIDTSNVTGVTGEDMT